MVIGTLWLLVGVFEYFILSNLLAPLCGLISIHSFLNHFLLHSQVKIEAQSLLWCSLLALVALCRCEWDLVVVYEDHFLSL